MYLDTLSICMSDKGMSYIGKACAYVTRGRSELLVFEGPVTRASRSPRGPSSAASRRAKRSPGR